MITILVNRSRVESRQTVNEAGLVNDLRDSIALSGFGGSGGFDDLWGVEEGNEGVG